MSSKVHNLNERQERLFKVDFLVAQDIKTAINRIFSIIFQTLCNYSDLAEKIS